MKQLEKELCEVSDWFRLGIQLGVEHHVLQHIEEGKKGIARCRIDMFSEWLKLDNNEWSDIVKALKSVGEPKLAEKVAKKHG